MRQQWQKSAHLKGYPLLHSQAAILNFTLILPQPFNLNPAVGRVVVCVHRGALKDSDFLRGTFGATVKNRMRGRIL